MSKGNNLENDVLALLFNNTVLPWSVTNLYVSLHTSDPGETGDQTSNETTYASYARVLVSRDGAGWTVSGSTVSNTAEITFPQCTGSPQTLTHVAVGTAASGTGRLLYKSILNSPLAVANLITPRVIAGAFQITED
jgi:hypothetical protein